MTGKDCSPKLLEFKLSPNLLSTLKIYRLFLLTVCTPVQNIICAKINATLNIQIQRILFFLVIDYTRKNIKKLLEIFTHFYIELKVSSLGKMPKNSFNLIPPETYGVEKTSEHIIVFPLKSISFIFNIMGL